MKSKKYAQFELITPERAHQILSEHNNANRKLRTWWAEAMAQAMKRGEFMTTHQGVAFSEDGVLLDGQHRLLAVERSGIPTELLVVYGIEREAFRFIDMGIKRSVSDLTGLAKRTAEVCRFAAGIAFPGTVMPDRVLQVADAGLQEVHDRLIEVCGSSCAITTAVPVRLAACLLVMDGHKESAVFQTYRDMALANFGNLPPVALAFLKQKEQKKIIGMKSFDLMARAMKALNPKDSHLSKIQVDSVAQQAAAERARRILRRALGQQAAEA